MYIRQAKTEDAPAACAVIRQSIAELCHADHGGDDVLLGKWLPNKTVVGDRSGTIEYARLGVSHREARADRQCSELIDRIATGAPIGKLLFIESFGVLSALRAQSEKNRGPEWLPTTGRRGVGGALRGGLGSRLLWLPKPQMRARRVDDDRE